MSYIDSKIDELDAEELNDEIKIKYIANHRIPYALLNEEDDCSDDTNLVELISIYRNYRIYEIGQKFNSEGTGGDYKAAHLRYKLAASLINKEARFLFAEEPAISIEHKGDTQQVTEDVKANLTVLNDLVYTVLEKSKFGKILIQAARDCFIGKRVAGIVNFNPKSGITVSFLPSTNFVYRTKSTDQEVIDKFVSFSIINDTTNLSGRRIYKKKFELIDEGDKDVVYFEEGIYDGLGNLIEEINEYQPTLLSKIPVAIFINDGLLGETKGVSEIQNLKYYEQWYSKLSNSDKDSLRKNMNPIRYSVDIDASTTKGLSTAPGSFWDLTSDQNLENGHPGVGLLESNMSYTVALGNTLSRIKSMMYEEIDMPNIAEVQATITSGKALKAIYWPLIVRSKEKFKMWGPEIKSLAEIIIEGALVYPGCAKVHISDPITPVNYEIHVEPRFPLPEDETEEKQNDLSEVSEQTMSRKSYMKKWRKLTDQEADDELAQIAAEASMLNGGDTFGGQDSFGLDDSSDEGSDMNQFGGDNIE